MAKEEKVIKIRLAGIILFVITVLGVVGIFKVKEERDRVRMVLQDREETIERYEIEVDSLREYVTQAELWIFNKDKKLALTQAELDRIKQLNLRQVYTIGRLEMTVSALKDSLSLWRDSVRVETVYVDNPDDPEGPSIPMIELPASFGWEDDYVRSWGLITADGYGESGFDVKSLNIDLTLGSRGWLSPDYVSVVTTDNPYINIDKNNFSVVQPKKIRPVIVGVSVGLVTGTVLGYFITR